MRTLLRTLRSADPRYYQIAALSLLLVYGITRLRFAVTPAYFMALLLPALATQWLGTRASGRPRFDPMSALISALGLATLLRTTSLPVAALASSLAIASKFLIRWNAKHLFNPTNFTLVALLGAGAPLWVSPGQYGHLAFFALGIACLGSVVVNRAARSDLTFT